MVGTTSVRGSPAELAAGAGAVFVTTPDAATVYRIDLDSTGVATPIGVGRGASGIAFGFGDVWVANTSDGTVWRIDPADERVVRVISTGSGPTGLAVSPDGVWVADRHGGDVARIDPVRNAVDLRAKLGRRAAAARRARLGRVVRRLGGRGQTPRRDLPRDHRGGPVDSIDPALAYWQTSWAVMVATYDGLVTYARAGGPAGTELVPDLAVALARPDAGRKSYVFRLRSGVRYADGSPVRASDFRRAFERLFTLGSPGTIYYGGIVGAARCRPKRPCDLHRGIATVDRARTVTFHLRAPDGDFLAKLALPFAVALPRSVPADRALEREAAPGTGPYRIASSSDRLLVLARNPYFHEWSHSAQPDGYPDRITYTAASDLDAAAAAVESGRPTSGRGSSPRPGTRPRAGGTRAGSTATRCAARCTSSSTRRSPRSTTCACAGRSTTPSTTTP